MSGPLSYVGGVVTAQRAGQAIGKLHLKHPEDSANGSEH